MVTVNVKHLCVAVLLAIIPAISFAHGQGLAADRTCGFNEYLTDTIPPVVNNDEPLPEPKKEPLVKRVPKSRRQVKPVSLEPPVRPLIKPRIIKPVVKVGL